MWCSTCQRDVPALASPGGGCLRCTKCGCDLTPPADASAGELAVASTPGRPEISLGAALRQSPLAAADWQLEADLRGVHRLITSLKLRAPQPHTHKPDAQATIPYQPAAQARASYQPREQAKLSTVHTTGWFILSLGLAIFACGAVLLVWSLLGQREDLWPIGMPLALLGQAGLILGLVLQLDGLWTANRKTAAVLTELDGELNNVRQATTLLSSKPSGSGQSFYLHLAEGASPHLLMSDLKGQLDLLAQQISR
jgi:hypothetical protein